MTTTHRPGDAAVVCPPWCARHDEPHNANDPIGHWANDVLFPGILPRDGRVDVGLFQCLHLDGTPKRGPEGLAVIDLCGYAVSTETARAIAAALLNVADLAENAKGEPR